MQMPIKPIEGTTEKPALSQLVIFQAGTEEFGVAIESIREIIKIGMITPIPDSPGFIKGIANVRGEIVTAIDVKLLFNLSDPRKVEQKHIIVTKQEDGLYGLIVDEVMEILRVQKKEIQPTPSAVSNVHQKYITGVISHDNRLIILLDLGAIFSHKDLLTSANFEKKEKLKHVKKGNKDEKNSHSG